MPTTESAAGGWNWRKVALTVVGAVALILFILGFLLLTGIIGEPETVLENLFRLMGAS